MAELDHYGLQGTVALVTGASSGIGRQMATTLAKAGATVAVAARRADMLETLVADIAQAGGSALAVPMDVTDETAVEAGLTRVEAEIGLPTVLVNNAGVVKPGGILNLSVDDYDATMALNQRAVWLIQQKVCQRLVEAGQGGAVVNISSITGLRTTGRATGYAVSKAAVAHITKVTAMELARHNIRVNAIAPGYFPTDMTDDFLESEMGQKLIRRIPMQRTGRLPELDGPLLLLASPLGSFITGAVLPVDGGHLVASL